MDNLDKRISIAEKLKNIFPEASEIEIKNFIRASNFLDRNLVLKRLSSQGIKKIKISRQPFINEKEIDFIDTSEIENNN